MQAFRQPQPAWRKDDGSPVTAADQAVERSWRQLLRQAYPDHGIAGEEFGNTLAVAPWVWVLDPIDGTAAYTCGHRTWGSLIALLHHGQPVMGLIDAPALDERWAARTDAPALWWCGTEAPSRCTTADTPNLQTAKLSASLHLGGTLAQACQLEHLASHVAVRHTGGDCVSHALLAAGQLDLVAEAGLAYFDFMALVPVIAAAGGVITDWRGRALGMCSDGTVLSAANAKLHTQAMALLCGDGCADL